jgi:Raf kinase inhibitor-like YbhB/YbcL family protein
MPTPVDGDIESSGGLQLTSPAFDNGEQMPDSAGFANENDSPPLHIEGVPDGTESFVLIMDDPEAEPVTGHVWDHWIVFDIDPDVTELPEGWDPDSETVTVAYNDFVQTDWGGPSPPEGSHNYRFKLFALDSQIGFPAGARKRRLGSAIAMDHEILAQTQIVGQYHAEQGSIF